MGIAKARQQTDNGMNSIERKYAENLSHRQMAGEIIHFEFEKQKLRLAKKTWYLPDFLVVTREGFIEFHEVKMMWHSRRHGSRVGWRDDSRVKIKVAAEMHPIYQFVAAVYNKGKWEFEYFK